MTCVCAINKRSCKSRTVSTWVVPGGCVSRVDFFLVERVARWCGAGDLLGDGDVLVWRGDLVGVGFLGLAVFRVAAFRRAIDAGEGPR